MGCKLYIYRRILHDGKNIYRLLGSSYSCTTRSFIICTCKTSCFPFIDWSHAFRNMIWVFPTIPEDSVILVTKEVDLSLQSGQIVPFHDWSKTARWWHATTHQWQSNILSFLFFFLLTGSTLCVAFTSYCLPLCVVEACCLSRGQRFTLIDPVHTHTQTKTTWIPEAFHWNAWISAW